MTAEPITMRFANLYANDVFSFAPVTLDDLPRGPITPTELSDILADDHTEWRSAASPKLRDQIAEAIEGVLRASLIADGMTPGKARLRANAIANLDRNSQEMAAHLTQRLLAEAMAVSR